MLPIRIHRVFLVEHRVDFRRRFDGLVAEAYRLNADPYAGDCLIFVKKDHTQIRIIAGDALGLYLVSRRFEGGRLKRMFPFAVDPTAREISAAELCLLLEGAYYSVHSRPRPWRQLSG